MTSRPTLSALKAIAAEHGYCESEGISDAIERGNRWGRALIDGGFGPYLEREYGQGSFSGEAVVRSAKPAGEAEIVEVEATLGFGLPTTYRRFLLEFGGLSFFNYWWDETTALASLVDESLRLRDEVAAQRCNSSPLVQACTPLQLIRFCDFHNHAGEFIYICNFRDEDGECPEFLWFHDDVFGGQDDLDWVNRVAARVSRLKDKETRSSQGGTEAVVTVLTERVDQLLAVDVTQREKLKAFEMLADELSHASEGELLTVLHTFRKAIKSKKLAEARDTMIEQLRRDGESGAASLPKLVRRGQIRSSPPLASESFSTFNDWLTGHVDRMIDEATENLSKAYQRRPIVLPTRNSS